MASKADEFSTELQPLTLSHGKLRAGSGGLLTLIFTSFEKPKVVQKFLSLTFRNVQTQIAYPTRTGFCSDDYAYDLRRFSFP